MSPTAYRYLDELLAAIAQHKTLYGDSTVIPFERGRSRDKVFSLAEKLAAEKARPMTEVVAPWSPWNGIERS